MAASQHWRSTSQQFDGHSSLAQSTNGSQVWNTAAIPLKPVPQDVHAGRSRTCESSSEPQSESLLRKSRTPVEREIGGKDSTTNNTFNESAVKITGWPSKPRCLSETGATKYAGRIWDVILSLVPFLFLILGFCALHLDQKTRSSFGDKVTEALRLGPSIFPIVYAAIVGRLSRAIAKWLAERGSRLGLLEQLVGSQNVFSSIERLVMLRRYGILSLTIVLLWLISPLGGQSSLRILELESSLEQSFSNVRYFDVNHDLEDGLESVMQLQGPVTAMIGTFSASMLAAKDIQRSPVDSWGNVKVPMLDELSPWASEDSSNPWITVPKDTSQVSYAAFTGLMFSGVHEIGKSQFSLETSYMQLKCMDGTPFASDVNLTAVFENRLYVHNESDPFTATMYGSPRVSYYNSFFFDYQPVLDVDSASEINVLYGGLLYDLTSSYMILFNCTVGQRYIEAEVTCDGLNCAIEKVRRSTLPETTTAKLTPISN